MPDGFFKISIREGLDTDIDLTLMEIPDTARAIKYPPITVAAGASNTTIPIEDFSTGTDRRPYLVFYDPNDTDELTIRVNGVAANREVMPFCVTSEVITSLTVSNADATNANTLLIFGLVDNLS